MRKSFDGLAALVKNVLQEDTSSGNCIWMKRLEQGQFHGVKSPTLKAPISWAQLHMIIAGIDVQSVTKTKRFSSDFSLSAGYNPRHEKHPNASHSTA